MKHIQPMIFGAFATNILAFAVVGGLQVSKNINSQTAITARQAALTNVAKHVMAESCWKYPSDYKLKIGDPIITKGTQTGKIPTSCIYSPKTKQFVEVGYLNSELQAIRIFSIKEVRAAKSQIKAERSK